MTTYCMSGMLSQLILTKPNEVEIMAVEKMSTPTLQE